MWFGRVMWLLNYSNLLPFITISLIIIYHSIKMLSNMAVFYLIMQYVVLKFFPLRGILRKAYGVTKMGSRNQFSEIHGKHS